MGKVAFVCNGSEGKCVFPPFILGTSAASLGDDVVIFFTPAGAGSMVKGELEKFKGAKGLPDIIELYEGIRQLGGKIYVCELALDAKDLKESDFREGVELIGATAFLKETESANTTYSFG